MDKIGAFIDALEKFVGKEFVNVVQYVVIVVKVAGEKLIGLIGLIGLKGENDVSVVAVCVENVTVVGLKDVGVKELEKSIVFLETVEVSGEVVKKLEIPKPACTDKIIHDTNNKQIIDFESIL